uniref:Bm221 n=1 Tax=Brugia malayi TaxID=6279 RepID=A0A1I9G092_BRUMA|nr:Bm221 [Brugia malayi]
MVRQLIQRGIPYSSSNSSVNYIPKDNYSKNATYLSMSKVKRLSSKIEKPGYDARPNSLIL